MYFFILFHALSVITSLNILLLSALDSYFPSFVVFLKCRCCFFKSVLSVALELFSEVEGKRLTRDHGLVCVGKQLPADTCMHYVRAASVTSVVSKANFELETQF